MHKVFLSLGSNIGDRLNHLEEAIKMISEIDNIELKSKSSFYETEPVGYLDQDLFMNCVIEIETILQPYEVLDCCMDIEQQLKRKRVIRWGPRTIDVDILIYDDIVMDEERLIIPHPRMTERAFVMVPLSEIFDDGSIGHKSVREYMTTMNIEGIRKITHEE